MNSRSIFKKKNIDGILLKEIENSLDELEPKYDELDDNRHKEKIAAMVNPSIKDYFLLAKSYLFMEKIGADKEESTDTLIEDINKNIYSSYNALLENLNYASIENLSLIVYDKYKLLGLMLTTDSFQEENLESLSKTVGNIIIYHALNELDIKIEEIDYIIQSDDIIKKASNS